MANQKASKWRPPAIGLIGLSQKPPVLRNVINLRDTTGKKLYFFDILKIE